MPEAQSALTPATAPRSMEGLLKESSFKLRLLANALGGLSTDDQKMAWHGMTDQESRATYILGLIQTWDQQNPGAAAAPSAPQAAPQQQAPAPQTQQYTPPPQQQPPPQMAPQPAPIQPQGAPQVQQIQPVQPGMMNGAPAPGPAAVSNAAQHTAAQATQPATSGRGGRRGAAAATNGVAGPAAHAPATGDVGLGAQVAELLGKVLEGQARLEAQQASFMTEVRGMLEAAGESKTGRVGALENQHAEIVESLRSISGAVAFSSRVSLWSFGTLLNYLPDVMGVSQEDLVSEAVNVSSIIPTLVEKVTGGK